MKFINIYSVIYITIYFNTIIRANNNWDLAVVINDQIELLQSNGSLIGSTLQQFTMLKALTFDNVRHQFIVSDMDQYNDTIFVVELTKETDITPIIKDLPDDVQGLAIDPITDILYWTDSSNKTINYLSLSDKEKHANIFLNLPNENPQGIAVDVCHRFIYWTNSDINNPTIDRIKLDGSEHKILINTDLKIPVGLAIDYSSQRLYWADIREGIYYRIESTNLEGKEREIVYEGTHSKPFGIAVDEKSIYWTDINNNALWKIGKFNDRSNPKKIRNFNEKPMGLVAKNIQITKLPDCKNLNDVKTYNQSSIEIFIKESDNQDNSIKCLNDGELINNDCKCLKGYTGNFCEISMCHNFCIHGDCYLSNLGYPSCNCLNNYGGKRCEKDLCDGFCLNGGTCTHNKFPKCECVKNYTGIRCEINKDINNICDIFCQNSNNGILIPRNGNFFCRCEDALLDTNLTAAQLFLAKQEQSLLYNHMEDPAFLILSCIMLIMLIALIFLSALTCNMKRHPRIKKRIIVNKNVTPLTYRPQPTTEQCEITIEDCCNMNVCETPCFEPPNLKGFQNNKEDKKKLISNMENNEECY